MISKETINNIKEKADIIEIISGYVALKKRGRNWQGLCPFHSEKTPSFTVSPEKMIWHCFGCGSGGNIFDFMMKINNDSFEDAVKEIAEKIGIEVVIRTQSSKTDRTELNKYYKIMKDAENYFSRCLYEASGQKTLKYLESRRIPKESIEHFSLGYAPSNWNSLFKELTKKYSPRNLEEVGLVIKRDTSNEYIDRFRGRLMFPIRNNKGKTIAFGGRLIEDDDDSAQPKYLNSPETLIYNKSRNLYAIDLSRQSIVKSKEVIIAEGYLDVILLHMNGFTNAVGILGTAFTNEHIYLIGNQINNVFLCFDNDEAGRNAALRAGELLKKRGKKVKVIMLNEKDPFDALVKDGRSKFEENMKSSKAYIEFCFDNIMSRYNLSEIEELAQAVNEVVVVLREEKEKIVKEKYAKDIAKKLGIDSNIILNKLNEDIIYRTRGNDLILTKPRKNKYFKAEEILLMSMASHIEYREKIFKEINPEDFIDETHLKLAKIFSKTDAELHDVFENIGDIDVKKIIREITLKEEEIYEELVDGCIKTIKEYHFKEKAKKVLSEINDAEKAGNYEYAKIKKMEYQKLFDKEELVNNSKN